MPTLMPGVVQKLFFYIPTGELTSNFPRVSHIGQGRYRVQYPIKLTYNTTIKASELLYFSHIFRPSIYVKL